MSDHKGRAIARPIIGRGGVYIHIFVLKSIVFTVCEREYTYRLPGQTAEFVRFRRDLGGGKLKNLCAGAQKCPRGGLRGGLWAASLPKGSHC
jgi:hypothetical protein